MERFFFIGTKQNPRDSGYMAWVEERIRYKPGEMEDTIWQRGFTIGPDYPSEDDAFKAAERLLQELFPDDDFTTSRQRSLV